MTYGASIEDAVWKHKYDIFYIKHQSLMLDIKILLLTVKTVLFGMGR
ncbi:sugar transferase [Aeromonas caviae]|nr:sugar transferase [Aeromonas caviae]